MRSLVYRNIEIVRRNLCQGRRELPRGNDWFTVSLQLLCHIFDEQLTNNAASTSTAVATGHKPMITASFDPDTKFSTARCERSMAVARRAYRRDLPPSYTKREHQRRITLALAHFRQVACGPATTVYEALLHKEFTSVSYYH
jgi:hypothetical protein